MKHSHQVTLPVQLGLLAEPVGSYLEFRFFLSELDNQAGRTNEHDRKRPYSTKCHELVNIQVQILMLLHGCYISMLLWFIDLKDVYRFVTHNIINIS